MPNSTRYYGITPSNIRAAELRFPYTATAGQTSFPAVYDIGYVDVFRNGSSLDPRTEFTATDGISVTLTNSCSAGDVVYILCKKSFELSNQYSTQTSVTTITATASQISFPHTYQAGSVFLVTRNGVDVGFSATDGSTVNLTDSVCSVGDIVKIYEHGVFSVANAVARSGDTMYGPLGLVGGSSIPTAPKFSNDTGLASTGFVQRALGNLSPYSVNNPASGPLTQASVGTVTQIDPTVRSTVQLPNDPSIPTGSVFVLSPVITTNNVITVSPPTGGYLRRGGANMGTNTAFSFKAQENVVIVKDSDLIYNILSGGLGMDPFLYGSSFSGASGYQKLPSGLIIQWGPLGSVSGLSSSTTDVTTTLPIAFPTAGLGLSIQTKYTPGSGQTTYSSGWFISNTQFTCRSSQSGQGTGFIAIGY